MCCAIYAERIEVLPISSNQKPDFKSQLRASQVLTADIEGYTAAAEQLAKEIASHDEDISAWTGDVKAATKVRDMEKATYDKTHADQSESIDALERAINVLKKQSHDRPQALIQLQAGINIYIYIYIYIYAHIYISLSIYV